MRRYTQTQKYKAKHESKLKNVAIANALQLEAVRRHASPFRFNYNAMPNLKSLNPSIAVLQRFC